ncbi:MAG: N-acetylmuramoyl-L-alanine amidase [Christensenellales bacterium]
MKIILNAGHTLSGAGSGAVGYINESAETRKVVNTVKNYLRSKGHTVVVVNVDKANTQSEYLQAVVKEANKHANADQFVSIHFNAGGGYGSECYSWKGEKTAVAVGICEELSKCGFRNRGVKDGSSLYVIKKTVMPATLVEVCFVDSRSDYELYKKLGVSKIAKAIADGIVKK